MNKCIVMSLVVCIAILIYPVNAHIWTNETVDDGNEGLAVVGLYSSLAIDGNGNPHISYLDATNGNLKYAKKLSGVWRREIVDYYDNVGYSTSIALDNGLPYISYYDSTNGDLKRAYRTLGWLDADPVDKFGNVGWYTSLAFDRNGVSHISYFDFDNTALKHAWRNRTDYYSYWNKEIVDNTGDVGYSTSLAIDNSGRPHISYYDYTKKALKHAWKINGEKSGWIVETVDSVGIGGYSTSLGFDSSGNPHISYHDVISKYNGSLKHAWKNGSIWSKEIVDTGGYSSSLAFDKSGRPHISYTVYSSIPGAYPNGDLKHACKSTGGVWYKEMVEPKNIYRTYQFPSLAFDSSGNLHISYQDTESSTLKYASGKPSIKEPC